MDLICVGLLSIALILLPLRSRDPLGPVIFPLPPPSSSFFELGVLDGVCGVLGFLVGALSFVHAVSSESDRFRCLLQGVIGAGRCVMIGPLSGAGRLSLSR